MDLAESLPPWAAGLLPGLVTAALGAYKDTSFEPFEPLKFWRSPVVTFLWYAAVDRWFPAQPVLLKMAAASTLERISVETYKAVWDVSPGKFKNARLINGECRAIKDRRWLPARLGWTA